MRDQYDDELDAGGQALLARNFTALAGRREPTFVIIGSKDHHSIKQFYAPIGFGPFEDEVTPPRRLIRRSSATSN